MIDQPEVDAPIHPARSEKPEVKKRPCWAQEQLDLLSDISSSQHLRSSTATRLRQRAPLAGNEVTLFMIPSSFPSCGSRWSKTLRR